MGIVGLLTFLKNSSERRHISSFRGSTVAIDTYCWLHKGVLSCADQLVRGEKSTAYVFYVLKYINLLRSYDIKPILVFDGQRLIAKKDTESKRRENRTNAKKKGLELLRAGKADEARCLFRQSLDITHEMALAVIQACRKIGVDCIVAPYEADAQLAFLNINNIVDLVITEDSDLILFGCKKILFKFDLTGNGILIENRKLHMDMKLRPDMYSFDKFRYMCIISGCDYLDSIKGIGLKKAHNAVCMTAEPNIYKLLPRLGSYLKMPNVVVTEEYIERFRLADATFRHQLVFDPIHRQLVHLTDPKEAGTEPEYLKNSGDFIDNEEAFQMALGNVDPMGKAVMDNWNPDVAGVPNSSIWSKVYRKPASPCKEVPIKLRQSTTKFRAVSVDTRAIVKVQEEYDQQLDKELQMYTKGNRSPEALEKREISPPPTNAQVQSSTNCNRFIKAKSVKRLSKFELTEIDQSRTTQSKYFARKEEDLRESSLSPVLGQSRLQCEAVESTPRTSTFPEGIASAEIVECNVEEDVVVDVEVNTRKRLYESTNLSSAMETFKLKKKKVMCMEFETERENDESELENLTPPLDSALGENSHAISDEDVCEEMLYTLNILSSNSSLELSQSSSTSNIPKTGANCKQTSRYFQRKKSSCRQIGLSRNKIPSNQPTLLSMFKKIEENK